MATPTSGRRRPRVRKTAPTIRQQVEAAQVSAEKSARPRRFKIPLKNNRLSRWLSVAIRPVKKVLRWLVPRYFVNSWREVRLVTWPSRRETWRLTGAVFIFAIVFGSLVAAVDKGLDEIFKKVILR